jgi:PEP-CTERM motif
MRNREILATLAILNCLLLGANMARADIVTYYVTGTVGSVADYSGSSHYVPIDITSGSTFVGYLSYDRSASGSGGIYRGTALNFAASFTIAGKYTYTLDAPTSSDEIDLLGSSFGLYARAHNVTEPFSPNPPFTHVDFSGTTTSDVLQNAKITSVSSVGLSDADATSQPYYYISANIATVVQIPEPSSFVLVGLGAGGLLFRFWKRRRSAE